MTITRSTPTGSRRRDLPARSSAGADAPDHRHARSDPPLPLARLRARGQLTELRAADLRFTPDEAAEFLNRMMGLDLRLTMSPRWKPAPRAGSPDCKWQRYRCRTRDRFAGFIRAFTGSHRFVLDYLVEEVLASNRNHPPFSTADFDPRPDVRVLVRCRDR